MTGLYCEHDRLAVSCEDCAYAAAKKAGAPVPPTLHPEDAPKGQPEPARRKRASSRASSTDGPTLH